MLEAGGQKWEGLEWGKLGDKVLKKNNSSYSFVGQIDITQ